MLASMRAGQRRELLTVEDICNCDAQQEADCDILPMMPIILSSKRTNIHVRQASAAATACCLSLGFTADSKQANSTAKAKAHMECRMIDALG